MAHIDLKDCADPASPASGLTIQVGNRLLIFEPTGKVPDVPSQGRARHCRCNGICPRNPNSGKDSQIPADSDTVPAVASGDRGFEKIFHPPTLL